MTTLLRIPENPILQPHSEHEWEYDGTFNGSVAFVNGTYHMVYRAFSIEKEHNGAKLHVSSIGYAKSDDGVHFKDHQLLISPVEEWEKYGCEDPRITSLDGKFYIFYTALSTYPFNASGIKLGLAITSDFKTIEKHPVTPFNAKAMALFPEKIDGKMAALLTINTDLPPAKIALAVFENEEDIWSPHFWKQWYENVNSHIVHLLRQVDEQVEVGAPPLKTESGWLFVHSYIKNYLSNDKKFGIEAALLDLHNPRKILGRTALPLLTPETEYERVGNISNVVFPSGAVIKDTELFVYYGAADKYTAVAHCDYRSLLDLLKPIESIPPTPSDDVKKFTRFEGNPIISPLVDLEWQKKGTFNPAAIYEEDKMHIVYRAQAEDGTSVLGYATSKDGFQIDENLEYPIYTPRESFEQKSKPGNSGCEDPRITKIGDRLYMTYTAYDGTNPPRVALTSIVLSDFLKRNWQWESPRLISPPGVDDKDACIVKKVKGEGYVAFHRLGDAMWVDSLQGLDFPERKYITGDVLAQPRKDKWDNTKIGIAAPPIETEYGWILLYHAVSAPEFAYKVGAMLLDYDNPRHILGRTDEPLLEPEKPYELQGQVTNVVFPCGCVVVNDVVYLYYGGADTVTCVATISLKSLTSLLLQNSPHS
jgi:predicted GH43/DUF377 family glycosyl hydrolase